MQVIPWGGEHPIRKLAGMNPERFGIEVSPGGSLLSVMQTWREFEGLEGAPTTTTSFRATRPTRVIPASEIKLPVSNKRA